MKRSATIQFPTRRHARPATRLGWRVVAWARSALLIVVAGMLSGVSVRAEDASFDGGDGLRQWTIYGGPEIAIYGQSAKGSSTSTQITGPRVSPPVPAFGDLGTEVSEPESSRELVASFLAGGTFGVLTPGLDLPYRPRAFLDVNISSPLTTETQLARRGNPGILAFPRGQNPPFPVGEGAMIGVGTELSAQQQGPQIHAGIGVSFEFPIPGDQLIRVKPAVMYSRTVLDLKAQVVRAVRLNTDAGPNQQLDDFRLIALKDERTEVYHAAGPSLEIEYVPGLQWGPFSISLFARGHGARTLGESKTEMQQCNTAGGQPNECVSWKYVQDNWAYRATAGVHLNWIPRPLW